MNEDITEMRRELIRLVRLSEGLVGIDLKRTNYKIAEIQNEIDHTAMRYAESGSHIAGRIQALVVARAQR